MWFILKTLIFHFKWKSQPRNLPFYISGIAPLSTFLYFIQVRSETLFHMKWKYQLRNLPFYIFGIALLSTFLYFSQVRSEIIATYALCGFANLSSIGIQLGALGPMAPSRRGDLAQIVLRALLGGIVTSLMTACIAGKNLSLSISFPISLNIFPDCCVSVQEPCIMIHPWTRIWLFPPYSYVLSMYFNGNSREFFFIHKSSVSSVEVLKT